MFDLPEFDRWRREADDAHKGARLQSDGGLHNWACFLAEQSAQLAVKGLLHGVGQGAWGNDLVALGEAMEAALEVDLPARVGAALQRLSRHYIPARYPDAHPAGTPGAHYGPDDVRQALSDLAAVLEYVDERWLALTSGGGASEPTPEAGR
jgi:HEPN domain-containing protein